MWCLTKFFKIEGRGVWIGLYAPGIKENENVPINGITITSDMKFLEYVSKYNGESSSGRTFGSEPKNVGSTPTSPS